MNGHCINIAISGISLKVSDELKIELRKTIPNDFGINWINIADPNIDLLLINENFFDTEGIQRILKEKKLPCLKVSKGQGSCNIEENNTLYLPFQQTDALKNWIQLRLLSYLSHQQSQQPKTETVSTHNAVDAKFLTDMLDPENARLHLFDDHGTLAIIDTRSQVAWLEPTRIHTHTNHSFNYAFATTFDFTKVSRKVEYNLQDWLWNLIWYSHEFQTLAPVAEEYYKIDYWPQPMQSTDRKIILLLSACFIQGAQLNHVASHLNIPIQTVQQYIAACIASNNGSIISAADGHYLKSNTVEQPTEQQGFLNKFFGKIRRRFGL
ncbi:hypothetical protein L313_0272 [Acinetobacter haemolyticus CIP 64.3 = MTCC 9819]|uniref:Uncharacterized protein n=2 Tax=Acinetobacter haemolyticus TaxID=29430 RepID=N9GH42_ACIHA|nr:hypothetical protein [Acinetobacter haemolyticus]ENW16444.1 hypothetical protein F927_02648 [Acinetobacter haemolyticus CIP 64.3 = MTCC 9819]EPR87801.1 hypothetical protein L313_0272 [Acinetobacter haemolyticus CIP 64.3 = MTCC 9819]NAR77683.1 hypothetical protein [Acinetobacter haemolyticus]QHI18931.1 hypothetical protein AhaeAN3_02645 [Acinetobacter haemolyticus]QXZ27044.1 hypothetical protein I6L22_01640 [Acinetobacter haemolyticus]